MAQGNAQMMVDAESGAQVAPQDTPQQVSYSAVAPVSEGSSVEELTQRAETAEARQKETQASYTKDHQRLAELETKALQFASQGEELHRLKAERAYMEDLRRRAPKPAQNRPDVVDQTPQFVEHLQHELIDPVQQEITGLKNELSQMTQTQVKERTEALNARIGGAFRAKPEHADMTDEEFTKLANFADATYVRTQGVHAPDVLERAYREMNYETDVATAKAEGRREVVKNIETVSQITSPQGSGGSTQQPIPRALYFMQHPDQYARLSEEERMRCMDEVGELNPEIQGELLSSTPLEGWGGS